MITMYNGIVAPTDFKRVSVVKTWNLNYAGIYYTANCSVLCGDSFFVDDNLFLMQQFTRMNLCGSREFTMNHNRHSGFIVSPTAFYKECVCFTFYKNIGLKYKYLQQLTQGVSQSKFGNMFLSKKIWFFLNAYF